MDTLPPPCCLLPVVCRVFKVHTLGGGEDDVNSVVLALPKRRWPAKAGAISFVAEQELSNAPVSRR